MEEYKKKLDSVHAPDALIAATLNRIHEEASGKSSSSDQKSTVIEPFKARRKRHGISAIVAAAAVLAIVIALSGKAPQHELNYGTVADIVVRAGLPSDTEQEWELSEYSALVGIDAETLLPDADIVKVKIRAEIENDILIRDECSLTYDADGRPLTLTLSATQDVLPNALTPLPPSDFEGISVYAAVSESGSLRLAGFSIDGFSFCLAGNNMDSGQFEELLTALIKNIKK